MADAFDTYREHFLAAPNAEMSFWIDFSRARVPKLSPLVREKLESARKEMEALEAGAISNQDEQRMVGHYWLRDSSRAPTAAMAESIRKTIAHIQKYNRTFDIRIIHQHVSQTDLILDRKEIPDGLVDFIQVVLNDDRSVYSCWFRHRLPFQKNSFISFTTFGYLFEVAGGTKVN